jgi:PilZ domain
VVISPAVSNPKRERRSQRRLTMRLPVTIKARQGKLQTTGYTRDLSSSGLFLYTESQFSEGSELEMVLLLPPELTGGERQWVCCRASVVRVQDSEEGGEFGVAASIRRMDVLPEIPG